MARTPLAYALSILAAEHILRLVSPGTHTFSKFINPSELIEFFHDYSSPAPLSSPTSQPPPPHEAGSTSGSGEGEGQGKRWITRTYDHGLPSRTEAEVRGVVYMPWKGEWVLMPRVATPWTTDCNYMFWVRRPRE